MLEESERGKSADRPKLFAGHSDSPPLADKKLTNIRHDGKSEDALGTIPLDRSEEEAEKFIRLHGNPEEKKRFEDDVL